MNISAEKYAAVFVETVYGKTVYMGSREDDGLYDVITKEEYNESVERYRLKIEMIKMQLEKVAKI